MLTLKKSLVLALILGLLSANVSYGIVIHDNGVDQDYIDYGSLYPSTVLAEYVNESGGVWTRGSAVVIDDGHWVITAAHNYFDSSRNPLYFGAAVEVGEDLHSAVGDIYEADQWFCHPGYTEPAYSADIALLYFEDLILGVTPAERYRGTLSIGDTISIAGYGRHGTPSTGYIERDYHRRGCENIIDYFGQVLFPEYAMFSDFFPEGHSDYNPLGGIGAPGDSGGGWYNADDLLSGITSAVNGDGYYDSTLGMDITYFNGWIDDVQASIPEPCTITLLLFGGIAVLRRRRV